MVAAYIFIEFTSAELHPGFAKTMSELRAIPSVKQAHILFGPTDGIAYLECPDSKALAEAVLTIRALRGIADTDTRQVAFD